MIPLRSRWLPALLLVAAALAACRAPDALVLDRAALMEGQVWRLWTGHLVHHTRAHLLLDVGVGVVLVFLVRPLWAVFVLPPLVGGVALAARPELASYAGLSGVLHGLTVLVGIDVIRQHEGIDRAFATGLLIGVVAKGLFETLTGQSVFSGGLDMGGPTVHAAHLAGALGGLALAAVTVSRPGAATLRPPSIARG